MKRSAATIALSASLFLFASLGCSHTTYIAAPPPPPSAPPPLVQLADRNGFQTGKSDGERESYNGVPYHPERTRAYHDTPGYDPAYGPFDVYRDAFRNAYIRGYAAGYRRG